MSSGIYQHAIVRFVEAFQSGRRFSALLLALVVCTTSLLNSPSADAQTTPALQGTITDQMTNAPLAGVSVHFCEYGGCGTTLTVTDANGNYSVTGTQIADQPTGTLGFQLHGYYYTQVPYTVSASPTVLNATLLYGGTIIQGAVTDANTQAGIVGATVQLLLQCVAGAITTICEGEGYATATTTSGGQYSFDASSILFPPGAAPAISISYINIVAPAYFTYTNSPSPYIPLSTPYPAIENFSLDPGSSAALQGTITDQMTNAPLAGVSVHFCEYGGCGTTLTVTDANGNYSVTGTQIADQPTGTLGFQLHGYYYTQVPYTVSASPTVLNATLLYGGTIIQGAVTDANTQAGIVGATVQLLLQCVAGAITTICEGEGYATATTTSGGQYSFDASSILFPPGAAPAISISYINIVAPAYFTYTNSPSPYIPLSTPYPAIENYQLNPTGLTQTITIGTSPEGLGISVDGMPAIAPQTYSWVPGNEHTIATTSPQTDSANNKNFFVGWTNINGSQASQLSQKIVVPNAIAIYTAIFESSGPAITPNITGTLGTNGWYTSNVSVSWSVTDPVAPITNQTGCGTTAITADTTGQTLTCSATSAGGTTTQSVTIKRDTTPPVATATPSPIPNANGWNKSSVTVSFTGTDATSGIASCSANVTVSTQGANQTPGTGTCTDNAGNVSAPVSATNISIDETPPVITASRSPSPNGAGWNDTAVTVTFTGTDALSGIAANGCTAPVTLSSNGAAQSVAGQCTDNAGNVASTTVTGINIDTSPPTAVASRTPSPNANGWNNTNVTVSFTGTDNVSGSGVASCSPSVVLSAQAANQSASGTCISVAGDVSAPTTITGINIDKTRPTIGITTPPNGANYLAGTVVDASYACADALSGVATCTGTAANGAPIKTGAAGIKTFVVHATDIAGNVATLSYTYSVTAASFSLSPNPLAFDDETIHVPSAGQTVTLTNTSTVALPITSIALTGTNPLQFSQTNSCGASVPATATCTITVVYLPTTLGAKTATLQVNAGGGAGSKSVALTGTGVDATYTLTPSSLACGDEVLHVPSAGQTVTLTNTGAVTLPITSIALTGTNPLQFSQTNTCGASVPMSATCTITVVYLPTTLGAKTATLQVNAGGGAGSKTVALSGTGT